MTEFSRPETLFRVFRAFLDEGDDLKGWIFRLAVAAIESCRQQLSGTTTEYMQGGQSQCSEQTSTEGPVLEEFIPIKRICAASDEEEEEDDEQHSHKKPKKDNATDKKKSDWLRSAQLWNQTPQGPPLQTVRQKKRTHHLGDFILFEGIKVEG